MKIGQSQVIDYQRSENKDLLGNTNLTSKIFHWSFLLLTLKIKDRRKSRSTSSPTSELRELRTWLIVGVVPGLISELCTFTPVHVMIIIVEGSKRERYCGY